jgi:hypothetical protein
VLTDLSHFGADDTVNSDLAAIAQAALAAARASGVAIALGTDGHFVCRGRAGSAAPDIGVQLKGSSGITGQCVRTGEVVYCKNVEVDPRVNAEACEQLGVKSIIVVPLWLDGKVIGVLEALSGTAYAFGAEQRTALNQFAAQIIERLSPSGPEPDLEHDDVSEPIISQSPGEVAEQDASRTYSNNQPTVRAWSMGLVNACLAIVLLVAIALLGIVFSRPPRRENATGTAPPVESAVHEHIKLLPAVGAAVAFKEQPPASRGAASAIDSRTSTESAREQPDSLAALESAAREGSPDAQYQLANAFATGTGVPKDMIKAYAWYIASGLSGNPRTQAPLRSLPRKLSDRQIAQVRFAVAQMFSAGDGLPQDSISAYTWFLLAGAAGHPAASQETAALAANMSADDIAEATSRAETWLARHRQGSR